PERDREGRRPGEQGPRAIPGALERRRARLRAVPARGRHGPRSGSKSRAGRGRSLEAARPLLQPRWGRAAGMAGLRARGSARAGPAWLHLVAGGGFNGSLGGYQLAARADSALASGVGVSIRTPWPGFAGDRRRSSVLDDLNQGPLAASPPVLQPGSVYCYPNP